MLCGVSPTTKNRIFIYICRTQQTFQKKKSSGLHKWIKKKNVCVIFWFCAIFEYMLNVFVFKHVSHQQLNQTFYLFKTYQYRVKLNESKCEICFTCSTITFYMLILQKFICRFKLSKNVRNFAFCINTWPFPPPQSNYKIRNINKNLNSQNSSFRSIKMICHNQIWCAHTRHTLEPILLGGEKSTKFMKYSINRLKLKWFT